MRVKIIEAVVRAYSGESLYIRKKSRILAAIGLGFGLICLVFAALMAATGAIVAAAVLFCLGLFCALVLALLRSGR